MGTSRALAKGLRTLAARNIAGDLERNIFVVPANRRDP